MIRYAEKCDWVLDYLSCNRSASTFDETFHEAYHERFGLQLVVYIIGPNRCPDANRTLLRMWKDGKLIRKTIGNQDAKFYCQPTYCHMYYLPDSGAVAKTYPEWLEAKRKPIRFRRRRRR